MLRDEAGPYDIFGKFREKIGITEAYINGNRELYSDGSLVADIVHCFWCLSIWVGWFVTLFAGVAGLISLKEVIFYTLATSAVAILIETKLFSDES